RFCSVPSERIRVDKLHEFVEKSAKLRDRLNVQGMQAFTARFLQLAGEIPDAYLTLHGKVALLARGLPQRYAEVVLKEDSKTPTPALHEIINTVLSRAAHREQAAAFGGSPPSSGSAPASSVDAISLAVTTFGWTREEATQHLTEQEGWAPRDTNGDQQGRANTEPASLAALTRMQATEQEQTNRIVDALLARLSLAGAGLASDRRPGGSGVAREVPIELAESRKDAGLCIKCGVVRYAPGIKGHNAATCAAPADKTTSAADGLKVADA
ncbi:MAG: hypothetical protein ABL886_11085, partial [Rhodoglobus sp.]